MADRNEIIGPQLPPHLQKPAERDESDDIKKECEYDSIGAESTSAITTNHKNENQEVFGPVLPPGVKNRASDISIGPSLPPGWNKEINNDNEEEEETVVGPLPSSSHTTGDDLQLKYEIESRARAMKDKLQGKNKESAPKREAWMTELPPELGANIGIVARTFKKRTLNTSESDRSVWTDTPSDRERKSRDQAIKKTNSEHVEAVERQRDIEMKKKIEEHNTQYRSASLMELHQEERKKKKGDGPTERRPFDRSTDLDLKKVDRKAANTFIKGAKGMNSKFENPKFESKYL